MKTIKGNIFSYTNADAICLTTNGFVKRSGAAVMGAGIAKQAKERWRFIDYTLGQAISLFGNKVNLLTRQTEDGIFLIEPEWSDGRIKDQVPYHIVNYPVKPASVECSLDKSNVIPRARRKYNPQETVPGFHAMADIDLIVDSAKRLIILADHCDWNTVILPRPGCGNGGLTWEGVGPILSRLLDNRFLVIEKS